MCNGKYFSGTFLNLTLNMINASAFDEMGAKNTFCMTKAHLETVQIFEQNQ